MSDVESNSLVDTPRRKLMKTSQQKENGQTSSSVNTTSNESEMTSASSQIQSSTSSNQDEDNRTVISSNDELPQLLADEDDHPLGQVPEDTGPTDEPTDDDRSTHMDLCSSGTLMSVSVERRSF